MSETRRLRVLFLTVWYPTVEKPLAGAFVRKHAKAAALYDDVVVVHLAGVSADLRAPWCMERESDATLTKGLPTYRVWHRRSPIPRTSYLLHLWGALRAFERLKQEGFRPDIIHAHLYAAGVPAVLIGRISRIPVVVAEHFSGFLGRTLGKQALWEARVAFGGSRLVMPVSRAVQQAIETYGIRARFQVVPNAVDTNVFYPESAVPNSSSPKRLLAVTTLDEADRKGTGCLLTALKQLSEVREDWHLDIVGDGPGKPACESMTKQLNLTDLTTFHGMQSEANVAALMQRAHVVVVPSLVETFSVVAAEALSSGTPVVATRCGGPEDFITSEVGMLVRPGDPKALSQALDYVLDHLERFCPEELSRYAAERFSPETVGHQFHQVYCDCLATDRR